MENESRRAFVGKAFAGVAGIGAVASLLAMKKTWDPLPSVIAGGFTTVDISALEPNVLSIVKWRGKPIFVLKHGEGITPNDARDVVVGEDRLTVVIGLCTHLGCIPAWQQDELQFKCACHGGEFDASGIQTFGPPPRPLDIPAFDVKGNTIVLGEEGEQYKKMTA